MAPGATLDAPTMFELIISQFNQCSTHEVDKYVHVFALLGHLKLKIERMVEEP